MLQICCRFLFFEGGKMQNLKISQKLFGGFFNVLAVLALAVGKSIWGIKGLQDNTDRIVNLRMPTAQASQQMMNNINASLAALRGRMRSARSRVPLRSSKTI